MSLITKANAVVLLRAWVLPDLGSLAAPAWENDKLLALAASPVKVVFVIFYLAEL